MKPTKPGINRKPALPAVRSKKVDIMKGKDKMREVDVPIHDNEIGDTDVMNVVKSQMMKTPPAGHITVGLSLGATLNVGDYQSARIDAFVIRNVPDIPGAEEAAFAEISTKLNSELQRQAEIIIGAEAEEPPAPRKRGR